MGLYGNIKKIWMFRILFVYYGGKTQFKQI